MRLREPALGATRMQACAAHLIPRGCRCCRRCRRWVVAVFWPVVGSVFGVVLRVSPAAAGVALRRPRPAVRVVLLRLRVVPVRVLWGQGVRVQRARRVWEKRLPARRRGL